MISTEQESKESTFSKLLLWESKRKVARIGLPTKILHLEFEVRTLEARKIWLSPMMFAGRVFTDSRMLISYWGSWTH